MNGVKRYPIRGFFGGLLAGLAVAILLVLSSVIALGTLPPLICIVVGMVLGVLWAMFGPTRRRKGAKEPATVGAPASGEGSMPDAEEPAAGEGPAPE